MDKQLRILFVQDSDKEVQPLLEELQQGEYEVSWERVYSRSMAKSALSSQEWDVVIASHEMARLSSLDILKILREKSLNTPFIIVSEYLEEGSVVNAIKAGAQDFVLKSNLTRLLSVIENCLQNTNNKPQPPSSNHSLHISDERLKLALEGNNTGLWDWNLQTGEIHFSPQWGKMLGYEPGELEPTIRSWHQLVHPDDIVDVQRQLEEHLEGNSAYYETEHRIRSKQGEWIWIQDRGRVVERDGEDRPLRVIGTYMDISPKKLAETPLYRKTAEFETIFRAIPDAVIFASANREIIMVNPAFTRLFGYKPDEVYGKKSAFLYADKKDFEKLEKVRSNEDAEKKVDLHETRYKKKNGEMFICETVGTPVKDAQGHTIGFVYIIRDISRRQKAEKAQQESEEKFRNLLEAAPQAILVTNEEGEIVIVNAMAEKLYGYDRKTLIGQTVEMLIPERLRGKHIEHRSDYITNPRSREMGMNLNLHSINKEGIEFPVEVSLSYIKIDGKTYVMSFITNISDRKKMEDILRESESSYRRMFEEDLTGNFVMTPEGKFLNCNLAFARIFGFSSVEEAKKTNFFSMHADPQFKSSFLDLLGTKKKLEFHEIELRHQDGRVIYIVENVIGMFDEKGKLEKIRGYLFDDTRRREIESQFMQAQKMESLGMLAGSIAHDFNNLLSVISANSEILLMKMDSEDPLRKSAEQIKQTSRQAAILTNQILTFSRKQVVQPRVIDLNKVVENVSKILLRLIGKDIEMKTVLNPNLGKVKIDPVQIEQIIINLAVNARDAMPGGGKLTIGTNNVVLDDEMAKKHIDAHPGHYALVAVSDTGTGMDARTRERIFEPFFTTKKKGKGTGLGLATVYGIVKQNKGFIDVYSELGKGSIFKIYLPAREEE
jgi:PAS domain S-box-containing protein